MHLHGFDVYRSYLAMKQHWTKENFDYFQYDGKVRAKEETYQQRNDFYFFETIARKLSKKEIEEYLLANFALAEDPTRVWIGDIKRSGKDQWLVWQKLHQRLSYTVEQDLEALVLHMEKEGLSFNQIFEANGGHPELLRLVIQKKIHLETLIILDMVLKFVPKWDRNLHDPLWESMSFKIRKYKPFLSIPVTKYKKLMVEKFL